MAGFQPPPTYALPILVDEKTGKAIFNPIWLRWFLDLAAVLGGSGGGGGALALNHNLLSSLQGGSANEYYHLTNTEHSTVELTSRKDAASGYAGLNASSRITKGAVTTDDLIVNLATKGLVLKDTQGTPHYWRVTVSNLGALVITDTGQRCPRRTK